MVQIYKVFFEERQFILSEFPVGNDQTKTNICHQYKGYAELKRKINFFDKNKSIQQINIYYKNLELLYKKFLTCFYFIEAAGGIVKKSNDEILFIFRRGKWDLPKGKIEKNEEPVSAAKREVIEECGLSGVEVIKYISHSFHTYKINNTIVLKKTWWYEMVLMGHSYLKPQLEEDITDVRWFSQDNLYLVINNTYASIKEILSYFPF